MIFCMGFVMGFSAILGDDNSIAGVVLLLFLMVFKNADFGIGMKDSLGVMGIIFAILIVISRLANSFGPLTGMAINVECIFLLVFLNCHNLLMFNQSTVVLGYLLLYGYDASGKCNWRYCISSPVHCSSSLFSLLRRNHWGDRSQTICNLWLAVLVQFLWCHGSGSQPHRTGMCYFLPHFP